MMGQRRSAFCAYGHGVNLKPAWTALACGAALMSDGPLPHGFILRLRLLE